MNIKTVEGFLESKPFWKKELLELRSLMISTGLIETLKWGSPVYTLNNKNVVGIGAFKSYCGIWFFQGALLKDDQKVLVNAQEGKTRAMRQWRFSKVSDIEKNKDTIIFYIREAIDNQKEGREIKPQKNVTLMIPVKLQRALDNNKQLEKSFNFLSLSCRIEYCNYISEAKKEETQYRRVEKIIPMILSKKGMNEKYKKK